VIVAILSSLVARSDNEYDARHVDAAVRGESFPRIDLTLNRVRDNFPKPETNDKSGRIACVLLSERYGAVDWEAGKVKSSDVLSDHPPMNRENPFLEFRGIAVQLSAPAEKRNAAEKSRYARGQRGRPGILIVARSARIISVRGEVWRFRELIGNAWPEFCRSVKHGNR